MVNSKQPFVMRKGGYLKLLGKTWKQPSVGANGMVSAAHPLASLAGNEVLMQGGNAFDAAVATGVALSVVEPAMSGILGSGFMLYRNGKTGEIRAIDNYSVAPLLATPDLYDPLPPTDGLMNAVDEKNNVGYLAVGVPGSAAAYQYLTENLTRLPLGKLIQPAIRFAEQGFTITKYFEYCVHFVSQYLTQFPSSKALLFPHGKPLQAGEHFQNPDYAQTLRLIAEEGFATVYKGRLAERIVTDIQAHGGLLSQEDLACYTIRHVTPLQGHYKGYEVFVMPPPSSGGAHILQMLHLLSHFPVAEWHPHSVEKLHTLIEIMKLAFADRQAYMGDPARIKIPLETLISPEYGKLRVKEIDPQRARNPFPGNISGFEPAHTTHFTVADGEGNIVVATQTINGIFGACVVVPGTGMFFNNTMRLFDPYPGRPNSVEGGKKMLSSMSPTLVCKNQHPFLAIGCPGGTKIFNSVLQAIVNVLDHQLPLQEAVEAPRLHAGTGGMKVSIEKGFPEQSIQALIDRGHEIETLPSVAGGMHAILFEPETGLMEGAACWRADGVAMGFSGGEADAEKRLW